MAAKFKIGDVVQLKSGGPKMTVLEVGKPTSNPYSDSTETVEAKVCCGWFSQMVTPRSMMKPTLSDRDYFPAGGFAKGRALMTVTDWSNRHRAPLTEKGAHLGSVLLSGITYREFLIAQALPATFAWAVGSFYNWGELEGLAIEAADKILNKLAEESDK
jgi:uncharacterized protein YodC (DUF2158 family)